MLQVPMVHPEALRKLRGHRKEILKAVTRCGIRSSRLYAQQTPQCLAKRHCRFPMVPTVTVAIPAWEEEDVIEETIRQIKRQTYPIEKIIVVDDGSKDNTGKIAKLLGCQVIRLPRDGHNTKCRALNHAIAVATTELILILDADTTSKWNAVEKLVPAFNDRQVACVSGKVFPRFVRTLWERGRFIEYLFGFMVPKVMQSKLDTILVSPGCFSVYRTTLLRKFGGFVPRTLGEDMDMTWTAIVAGRRVEYRPDATCYPVEPRSAKLFIKQSDRWDRSFLQCIKVRLKRPTLQGTVYHTASWLRVFFGGIRVGRLEVFGTMRPGARRLTAMVSYYMVKIMLMPVLVPIFFWELKKDIGWTLTYTLLTHLGLEWLPALIEARRQGLFWTALTSLPAALVTQYVGIVIYLRAFILESLGFTLMKWNKGH